MTAWTVRLWLGCHACILGAELNGSMTHANGSMCALCPAPLGGWMRGCSWDV